MISDCADQAGQSQPDTFRFHMPVPTDGHVDGIEAHLRGGSCQAVALHELQMPGKDGDFQFVLGCGIARGNTQQSCSGEQSTPGKTFPISKLMFLLQRETVILELSSGVKDRNK